MNFEYEIERSVLIAKLGEEIDHHNAEVIRRNLDRMIDSHYIKGLVLDFENTKFIDSSGIGVIMGRYNHMQDVGGSIGMININRNTDKLFRLSGIYRIIETYSNKDEAIVGVR